MIQIENHCIGCAVPSYPCMGNACPRRNVEVHYCDRCEEELEEIFLVDGEELCEECLKDKFRKED